MVFGLCVCVCLSVSGLFYPAQYPQSSPGLTCLIKLVSTFATCVDTVACLPVLMNTGLFHFGTLGASVVELLWGWAAGSHAILGLTSWGSARVPPTALPCPNLPRTEEGFSFFSTPQHFLTFFFFFGGSERALCLLGGALLFEPHLQPRDFVFLGFFWRYESLNSGPWAF
jgi:hypothetical protein